jgi:hypothetical protein
MSKHALCIGNGKYPGAVLQNPKNDAAALGKQLQALGFLVRTAVDVSLKDMDNQVKEFQKALRSAEVGLFFFAGHGIQIDGVNYLTATNTDFGSENDAKFSSLQLDKVIEIMEQGHNQTSILVLDACRNNPYERSWRGGPPRGLAPVYAPKGTIIAFATSPGELASDGQGKNGAFTEALLAHISTQDLSIESLLKRVRNTLSVNTSGKQTSWEHTSLMGDFFFNRSLPSGDFVAVYSRDALEDGNFFCNPETAIGQVILGLKTYNYYKQNEAVETLRPKKVTNATRDELFVLGRNINQAATGGARGVQNKLRHLSAYLSEWDIEAAFHLLNGILYEIYFDHQNILRREKRTDFFEEIFALEDASEFKRSFDFIASALIPVVKQVPYVPRATGTLSVNVSLNRPNAPPLLRSVHIGADLLISGVPRQPGRGQVRDISRTDFEAEILQLLPAPRRRAFISYNDPPGPDTLRVPYRLELSTGNPLPH